MLTLLRKLSLLTTTLLENSPNKIGVYVSSIDLFFSKREEALWESQGVILELVTVENGYPTQNVIAAVNPPGRDEEKEFTADNWFVKTSDDGTEPTKFTFDSPVFLQNGVEYAIVIKSNSNNYHVYVANVGDTDVTTGKLIAGQPHLGVFFTSQNASTWTADQNKDLKFRINRCKFTKDQDVSFTFLFPQLPLYDGALLEYRGHSGTGNKEIFLLHSNNHGFNNVEGDDNRGNLIDFFYPSEAN